MRIQTWLFIVFSTASAALAMEAPPLPTSAKKLTKDQIVTLMHGKTFKYKSYNHDALKTGKTTFDFKTMTYGGTYTDKGKTKDFKGEPLSLNADGYCYAKTCPEGQGAGGVYLDGATIYELTDKGTVGEILTR